MNNQITITEVMNKIGQVIESHRNKQNIYYEAEWGHLRKKWKLGRRVIKTRKESRRTRGNEMKHGFETMAKNKDREMKEGKERRPG